MSDSSEIRLVELETHVAQHENTIQELSDMVAEQWRAIDRLKQEIGRLQSQVEQLEDSPQSSEVPPPHY